MHVKHFLLHKYILYFNFLIETASFFYPLITPMCLSIGTPKAINFPFVSNEKLMFFRCPNIQAHYNEAVIYLKVSTTYRFNIEILSKLLV